MKRVQDGSFYLEVLVRSQKRPNHKLKGIIEHSRQDQSNKIGVLAGSLAEELCERHGDTIDPSIAAREAIGAYHRMATRARLNGYGDELPIDATKGFDTMGDPEDLREINEHLRSQN